MGRILAEISAELDRKFRELILKKYGVKKGALKMAVEEAIKLWVEREERYRKDSKHEDTEHPTTEGS